MPYIECDGKIYSRGDSSVYVKNCIQAETKAMNLRIAECQANVKCREEKEFQDSVILGTGILLFSVLTILFIFAICSLIKE